MGIAATLPELSEWTLPSFLFTGSVLDPLDSDVVFNQNDLFCSDFRGSVSFCLNLGLNSDSFLLYSGST